MRLTYLLMLVGLLAAVLIGCSTKKVEKTPVMLKITDINVQRFKEAAGWIFIINLVVAGDCENYTTTWTLPDGQKAVFAGSDFSFSVTVPGKFDLPVEVNGCGSSSSDIVHLSTSDPLTVAAGGDINQSLPGSFLNP